MNAFLRGLQNLRRQWHDSAILRLGIWAAVGIVWLNLLWTHTDRLVEREKETQLLQTEVGRLEGLKTGPRWEARVDEARSQLDALEAMAWTEATPGLAQAALQDFLTQSITRSGMVVKEVRLSTDAVGGSGATMAGQRSPAAAANEVRARVVAEYKPQPLARWLKELSSSPQPILIDRFQLRQWLQVPQVELDVRIVVRRLGADK